MCHAYATTMNGFNASIGCKFLDESGSRHDPSSVVVVVATIINIINIMNLLFELLWPLLILSLPAFNIYTTFNDTPLNDTPPHLYPHLHLDISPPMFSRLIVRPVVRHVASPSSIVATAARSLTQQSTTICNTSARSLSLANASRQLASSSRTHLTSSTVKSASKTSILSRPISSSNLRVVVRLLSQSLKLSEKVVVVAQD
jgi:hypothetical protein